MDIILLALNQNGVTVARKVLRNITEQDFHPQFAEFQKRNPGRIFVFFSEKELQFYLKELTTN